MILDELLSFPDVVLESTDDLSNNFINERLLSIVDKSVWYEGFAQTDLVRAREGRTRFWLANTRFRNTSESDSGTGVSRTSDTDSCLEQTLNTRVRSSLVSAVWSRKFSCARIPCSKCPWRIPFGLQTATDPVYHIPYMKDFRIWISALSTISIQRTRCWT